MKKVLILCFMIFSIRAEAATLTLTTYESGADVTIPNLESDNNAIESFANGGVESINIADGTIESSDLAPSISPVTRWDQAFSDFTYDGMIPATDDSDLTSDVSSGTSYVNGYYISNAATPITYTASKDNYLYLHQSGQYLVDAVASGATPTAPADSLLLANVVTDSDNITSVTDLRTTSIQITADSSTFPKQYRSGCLIVRDSTTTIHAEPGYLALGTAVYSRTSDTTAYSISDADYWIEDTVPNLTTPSDLDDNGFWVYAYNNSGSLWDIKYSSADPVYADTSENTGGRLRYYKNGDTYYRAIGWAFPSADAIQTYAYGQFAEGEINNSVYRSTGSLVTCANPLPYDDTVPTKTEGNAVFSEVIGIRPTDLNSTIYVEATVIGAASAGSAAITLIKDGASAAVAANPARVANADVPTANSLLYEIAPSSLDRIEFELKAGSSAGTYYVNGAGGTRTHGGICNTYIKVYEELN